MAEYAEDIWALMQKENTHIYMCGSKGMEAGLEECFGPLAVKNGLVWKEFAKSMKKADRYHVDLNLKADSGFNLKADAVDRH